MERLRMLYVLLRDIDLDFQGHTSSCYAVIENAQVTDIPDRFASTRTATAVELLLSLKRKTKSYSQVTQVYF